MRNIRNARTCLPVRTARRRTHPQTWDDLFHGFFTPLFSAPLHGTPQSPQGGSFEPRLDLTEAEKAYTLVVELPGLSKEEIEIELREDEVLLRGEKKPEAETDEETVLHSERRWGSFERHLRLPAAIDADAVEARFRQGVLTVHLPKTEPGDGPRKIAVND